MNLSPGTDALPRRNMQLAPGLAERIADLPPPVIVFNKSHSGSRLLAAMLQSQKIFIGSVLNESLDALSFVPLVEHAVLKYYPDFGPLWRMPQWPDELQTLLETAIDEHLAKYPPGAPWGWKLCETGYILPLLAAIFPQARYVHLIRDGRDVAFCDHTAPERPFWRKIYFGTDALCNWNGMRLDQAAYERRRHLYNARHWQECVQIGRAFGAMLGPVYRELRYEGLCTNLTNEGRDLMAWLGVAADQAALAALATRARTQSIGKHRDQPRKHQQAVQRIIEPTLLAAGYACDPLPYSMIDTASAFIQRAQRAINRRRTPDAMVDGDDKRTCGEQVG